MFDVDDIPFKKTVYVAFCQQSSRYLAYSVYDDLREYEYYPCIDLDPTTAPDITQILINTHAHFLLVLTPGAGDLCGDALRAQLMYARQVKRRIHVLIIGGDKVRNHYLSDKDDGMFSDVARNAVLSIVLANFDEGMVELRKKLDFQSKSVTEFPTVTFDDQMVVDNKHILAQAFPMPTLKQLFDEYEAHEAHEAKIIPPPEPEPQPLPAHQTVHTSFEQGLAVHNRNIASGHNPAHAYLLRGQFFLRWELPALAYADFQQVLNTPYAPPDILNQAKKRIDETSPVRRETIAASRRTVMSEKNLLEHITSAEHYIKQGNYEYTLIELKAIAQVWTANEWTARRVGNIHAELYRKAKMHVLTGLNIRDEMIKQISGYIPFHPKDNEWYTLRGHVYASASFPMMALADYVMARQITDSELVKWCIDEIARSRNIWSYYRAIEKRQQTYDAMYDSTSRTLSLLYQHALLSIARGRTDLAQRNLEQLVELTGGHERAETLLRIIPDH